MIRVPDAPIGRLTGAWRHRVGTGRHDLALCRGFPGSAESACACRWPAADVGRVGLVLRRGFPESAESARTHRRLTADAGRVYLPLTLGRHEVTLVELTPAADGTPLWWDEWRLPGREAA
ncbi:hypothetical protein PV963_34755 [Streptomyces coeruleorubidus]|uniref:hypothetical protein n=1 Tax=Streptomyces coeruleorubidus TaxID=116188 RepID=UPI00237EFC85|nr:hypothetical protein [Streptomyces coeruleorubidus]WDV55152.1 hypothetical protein PV963_34755 [Streptomyces coeruleorubidus]